MSTAIYAGHLPRTRIFNFTPVALSRDGVLNLSLSEPGLISKIRSYADLPALFLVAAGQEEAIAGLLAGLRSIRSSCYPYGIFALGGDFTVLATEGVSVVTLDSEKPEDISAAVETFVKERLLFDRSLLDNNNAASLPEKTDVLIVGGGITGLYAARECLKKGLQFVVVEQRDVFGGIWSQYANTTSQVNTSEAAYRLTEKETRNNRDHSSTREMLEDLSEIGQAISPHLFTRTEAVRFDKLDGGGYRTRLERDGKQVDVESRGLLLAINDRVGTPRRITWPGEEQFAGSICAGISDEALGMDWKGKKVVVTGMGAFAIENVRTALEGGAAEVTVVCRRHGTVCPKIIDYLNFATPYDENFQHEKKSNIKNMMLWKKLYDLSGATQPECWMGKIKHEGHTISVSDIWFVAHHLGKLNTHTGSIASVEKDAVVLDDGTRVTADIIVNCVGFHRMSTVLREMCDYHEMYNNNYIDKDLMYLADAYIDDDVFNSFFGSSVLEMTKFYMEVYLRFFDSEEYDTMIQAPGIGKIPVEDRRWSHYIAGSEALMDAYPEFRQAARDQIDARTRNFKEAHDLSVYIAQNKREWLDTHHQLAGRQLSEAECLPYVFEKLLEQK